MTDLTGSYRFVAWSRRGLAAGLPPQPPVGGRASLAVTLDVQKGGTQVEPVTKTLRFFGPGDVVQIDARQIIRREPRPGTSDFEPNYFPLVEFDAPEFPWLLSPDPSDGRVAPWLVLVAVRRDLAQISVDPRRPLPWLSLAASDAQPELPDLSESWAWAHAQIAGSDAPAETAIAGPPELTLARIICPRRLHPQTTYVAALVPAYRAGVQAGLGQPVDAAAEPAWPPPGGWGALSGRLELPVYDHWEFATAETGDFEQLVRRLRPHAIGPDVGALPLDVSAADPAFGDLGLPAPTEIPMEGALTSPVLPARQWPAGVEAAFQARLEQLIEAPPGVDLTVLRPPIYGSYQAGTPGSLPAAGADRPWLRELNLDPAWRAGAALGGAVVQQLQEQLMASAWDQAGELERANALLRQAQLARTAAAAVREKHLDGLPPDAAVRLTAPLHGRVRVGADGAPLDPGQRRTLRRSVATSVFPQSAVSPPFRRALRPTGPLAKRLPGPPQQATGQLAEALAQGVVRVPVHPARGGADFDDVAGRTTPPGQARFHDLAPNLAGGGGWQSVSGEGDSSFYPGADPYAPAAAPAPAPAAPPAPAAVRAAAAEAIAAEGGEGRGDWGVDDEGRRADRVRGINYRFQQATSFLLQHLPATVGTPPPPGPQLDLGQVAGTLVSPGGVLEPDHTVAREVVTLVPQGTPSASGDVLRPRAATPRFPQPMSEPLRDVDGDMLLPGIDLIAADSVGVLLGNPRFVEAYMAGLNHELSREMLWRGLPVDLAATFADRFWDIRGSGLGPDAPAQIPPIDGWQAALGGNAVGVGGPNLLVMIVRGRLLQRYPHTAIYMAKAVPKVDAAGNPVDGPDGNPVPAPGAEERLPLFRGTVDPDVTYLGFDVPIDEARGHDGELGWFFVVQEQPTAPRFGLDEPGGRGQAPLATWSDLEWGDLYPSGTDLGAIDYAAVAGPLATPTPLTLSVLDGRPDPTATWGADSARMAAITYQRPVRVSIHARTALPPA